MTNKKEATALSGVGTDILEISRFRASFDRYGEKFLQRIFSQREIDHCQKYKDPTPRYAVRFCAKEAVVKALGVGFGKELSFHDIEILNDPHGKPYVTLSVKASAHFNNPTLLLSLSHCRNYATAVVIASF